MDWIPRDCNPNLRIFIAALRSRSNIKPQLRQWKIRTLKSISANSPQPEHILLVLRGFTCMHLLPAFSALYNVARFHRNLARRRLLEGKRRNDGFVRSSLLKDWSSAYSHPGMTLGRTPGDKISSLELRNGVAPVGLHRLHVRPVHYTA